MAQGVWVKVFPPPPVVKPELPGLGGWADVSDAPTSTYTDAAGVKWNVWTFAASGTLNVSKEGLLDCLIVGAGGRSSNWYARNTGGGAGAVRANLVKLPAGPHQVTVGVAVTAVVGADAAASTNGTGGSSSIGAYATAGGGQGSTDIADLGAHAAGGGGSPASVAGPNGGSNQPGGGAAGIPAGLLLNYDGTSREYGRGGSPAPVHAPGEGGWANGPGTNGIVIVRRPA